MYLTLVILIGLLIGLLMTTVWSFTQVDDDNADTDAWPVSFINNSKLANNKNDGPYVRSVRAF